MTMVIHWSGMQPLQPRLAVDYGTVGVVAVLVMQEEARRGPHAGQLCCRCFKGNEAIAEGLDLRAATAARLPVPAVNLRLVAGGQAEPGPTSPEWRRSQASKPVQG